MNCKGKNLISILNYLKVKKFPFDYDTHKEKSCEIQKGQYILLVILKKSYSYIYYDNYEKMQIDFAIYSMNDYEVIQMFDSKGNNLNNTHQNIKTMLK